jgi:outer membrane protein
VGTARDNTRIAAGALNNPSVFERNAEGIILNQLITDFGRTANLTASAKSKAQAEAQHAEATREEILLQVNSAYFSALEAQSVLNVGQQTVKTRQTLLDQVQELAKNKLRSDLDVSFAKVNLQEGKLLVAQGENDLQASLATLSSVLGYQQEQNFTLAEEPPPDPLNTPTAELVQQALQSRPELARLGYEHDSAVDYAKAEKKLVYPTISAIGTAGIVAIRDEAHLPENYAAGGVNLSLPLFAGGLYSARRREAELRAQAAGEALRDEQDHIIREVRVARLNLNYAFERVDLTAQLLQNANQAFDLTQARYNLGSSSIVDLSQAQLNKTSAEIAQANAKYQYHLQRAILDFQVGRLR